MTTIDQIKQELKRRIAAYERLGYPEWKEQHQSDRALLTAIEGLEMIAAYQCVERCCMEANDKLQTICEQWEDGK